MERKKYLVTGGTGFIGSALVKRLVSEGHKVRVLDNDIRGVKERLDDFKDKIELIECDIRNSSEVQKACVGIDSVIHLAYINGTEYFYKMPELVLEVGVKGMVNIIDGCIRENIKEIILASSSEVYQSAEKIPTDESVPLIIPDIMNPRYSYGGGKIISELMTISNGRKKFDRAIIFRPHNVYGPDMGWEHVIPQLVLRMKKISQENDNNLIKFPLQGTGLETRAFCYIEDFIDGLMTILEKGEHLEIYHIGTMEEVSIKKIAEEIGKYFGKEVEIISGEEAKGGTKRRCPDITKLKKLGFSPKFTVEAGLKKSIKWYIENSDKIRKLENE
tara:strand:+ start:3192 stop:4184 length:993 start_codon:yes stop_codon:yes gene_type:complete